MSMTDKVLIQEVEALPFPRIAFPHVQALADWYADQLTREYSEGKRALAVNCFATEDLGFSSNQAAYVVLRSLTQFLYSHEDVESLTILCGGPVAEDVESLTILCGGPVALRGYSLNWNMWYAEFKPDDDDDEE